MALIARRSAERNDFDFDCDRGLAILDHNVLSGRGNTSLADLFDDSAEFVEQTGARRFEEVETGLAGGEFKIAAGSATGLHDFEGVVDHHRGRNIPAEQQAVGFSLHVDWSLRLLLLFFVPGRLVELGFYRCPGVNDQAKGDRRRN